MKSSDGLHDDKQEGDPLLLTALGGFMHLPSEDKFEYTRSYAALRAADLDWIVGPGYSLGRVHSGEKP